jgi:hypothetical protein
VSIASPVISCRPSTSTVLGVTFPRESDELRHVAFFPQGYLTLQTLLS